MSLSVFSEEYYSNKFGQSYIPTHGIGFRTAALGYNYDTLEARFPEKAPNLGIARSHINWQKEPTPFVSVYTSWSAALRRARWYVNQGAEQVVIAIIDLKGINPRHVFSGKAIHEYVGAGSTQRGHNNELLIYRKVDEGALLSVVPATGREVDVRVPSGLLKVPRALVEEAGGDTAGAICQWVVARLHALSDPRKQEMTSKIMHGMFVYTASDILDDPYGRHYGQNI